MKCPKCGAETRATETRKTSGIGIRRRRRCESNLCDLRFTTLEVVVTSSTRHDNATVIVLPSYVARDLREALSVLNQCVKEPTEPLKDSVPRPTMFPGLDKACIVVGCQSAAMCRHPFNPNCARAPTEPVIDTNYESLPSPPTTPLASIEYQLELPFAK